MTVSMMMRRQTRARLIEQEPLWLGHQGHAQCQHLLLAAAHGACSLRAARLQHRKQLVNLRDEGSFEQQTSIFKFCSTDRFGNTLWPCGTKAIPRSTVAAILPAAWERLSYTSWPRLGACAPTMHFSSVVLPAPFGRRCRPVRPWRG